MTETFLHPCDVSEREDEDEKKNLLTPKFLQEPKVIEPFRCVTRPLEAYRCKDCQSYSSLLTKLKTHSRTGICVSRDRTPILCYSCDFCNFKTFSRLVLLRHIYSNSCAVSEMKHLRLLKVKSKKRGEHLVLLYNRRELILKNFYEKPETKRPLEKCLFCKFTTRVRATLYKHMVQYHMPFDEVIWYTCVVCQYKSRFISDLEVHQMNKHKVFIRKLLFTCKRCGNQFRTNESLNVHFAKKHGIKEEDQYFRCDKCPHKTLYKRHFARHLKEQHGDGSIMIQCEHCEYKAKQKIHMKLHVINKHTADEDIEWYNCTHCDYKAKLKAGLKEHILRKHTTNNDWFQCELCKYKTLKKYELKVHVKKKHNKVKKDKQ